MKKKKIEFADLHHHTEHSLLDAFGSVTTHVQRCVDLGHTAVAMTEHGTLRGMLALEAACKSAKVKPIYGCEFYVTVDHKVKGLTPEQEASVTSGKKGAEATKAKKRLAEKLGINERRHLVLLAENDQGLKNLIRLSNIANRDGFYHKPRIDLDLLEEFNEGLIVNSGCIGSVIAASALSGKKGDMERAIDDVLWFKAVFGDRFSLEIQPHPIEEQSEWNKVAVRLSKAFGIPLIAANDSHYPAPDDWRVHDTLVAIGHGNNVHDCDRMRYEIETFGLKDSSDMVEAFARVHEDLSRSDVESAIERAAEQAERCNASVWKPKTILLPNASEVPPNEELRDFALDGWEWRRIEANSERNGIKIKKYLARLKHELNVIEGLNFAPYFTLVRDLIQWARDNGIGIGPGRGSSAGSLVCYLLGITSLDPLEHGLLFERFLTPGRLDWPDIDIDFEDQRRHEVFVYLVDKYGTDNVAQITTIGRMKGRSALKDVARAHGVSRATVDAVTSSIVEVLDRDSEVGSIEQALETDPDMKKFAKAHSRVVAEAIALEGNIRQVGIHPAGIVISPISLIDFVPVERRKVSGSDDPLFVTAFDKDEIPQMGLVKLDILGVKMLSVLADAQRLIEKTTGIIVNYEELTFDDADVLQGFTDGDYVGVFQYDSPTARAAAHGVVFDSFEDVVALNALNRPGPAKSGLADDWRSRKAGHKGAKQNPTIAKICADTLGVIVYQEHVIRILQELAGYSPEEAGRLRKAISKSAGAGYLEADRPAFVRGANEVGGMEEDEAESLWTQIEQFGSYGFNKSHAAVYSAISYWCMWAKTYYPNEFFCALLTHEKDPAIASRIAREAERRGVKVSTPSANFSQPSWTVAPTGELVAGLEMIKGIGSKPATSISAGAPYKDFVDFISKVNRRAVHKGVVVALAKSGALDELVGNTRWFIDNVEDVLKMVGKKGWSETILAELKRAEEEEEWFTDEDRHAEAISVGISGANPLGVLKQIKKSLRPSSDWTSIEDIFDGALIHGVMTAKKVGTSGKRKWAAIEIEDGEGEKIRLRLDEKMFHLYRPILDSGVGSIVAARVAINKKSGTGKPTLLVDMLSMRRRWLDGEELTWQERSLFKDHPAGNGVGKWWKGGDALVLSVKEVTDRNGKYMAFVSMDPGEGASKAREVVFFSSVWEDFDEDVYPGRVVRLWGKLEKASILADKVKV